MSRDREEFAPPSQSFILLRKSPRIHPCRVAFLAPSPPSSLPSWIVQHHRRVFFPYFSRTRVEFLLRYDRNLRLRFYISLFFSSSSRVDRSNVTFFFFFFLLINVTNDERSRDEYRIRREKRQENSATTDCASSCKPTGQMQCARCNIYASSEEGIHCSNKAWKSYQFYISFVVLFLCLCYIVRNGTRDYSFFTL